MREADIFFADDCIRVFPEIPGARRLRCGAGGRVRLDRRRGADPNHAKAAVLDPDQELTL